MLNIKQFIRAHAMTGCGDPGGPQHYCGPAPGSADAVRVPQGFSEVQIRRGRAQCRVWASQRELSVISCDGEILLVAVHHSRISYEQELKRQQELCAARARAHGARAEVSNNAPAMAIL